MKEAYYICHCGSGHTVFEDLLELVKIEGNKILFHIEAFDWEKNKVRTITLKAFFKTRLNFYNEKVEYIDFKSTKEQFKYSFIRRYEIEDNVEPEKHRIIQ